MFTKFFTVVVLSVLTLEINASEAYSLLISACSAFSNVVTISFAFIFLLIKFSQKHFLRQQEKLAEINAEGRPIWKPMHMQPIYGEYPFVSANGGDVGADIFERGLCLPSDNKMTAQEQAKIIEVIRSCFD